MKFPERLETKRLVLRRYRESDINNFYQLLQNKQIIENFNLKPKLQDFEEVRSLFSSFLNIQNSSDTIFALAICNKLNDDFLGTCGLKSIKINTEMACFYAILPSFQDFGFAIEAMLKLLEYAFEVLKSQKIIIHILSTNSRSWKVAERIGMKYLGHVPHFDSDMRAMLFSIEKKEYEAQRFY
ncbi:hypothetical protein LCGC14_1217030 [marine sediment metagenome]|uniref:N-acetyltransferase domain-containing protein n=1 Tax=marine sediment metagenome TaxID=412755 RepID=A0A0F9LCF7_9ZZZZ